MQFLHENNLTKTLQVLQDETATTFNTMNNKDGFIHDILEDEWDVALRTLEDRTRAALWPTNVTCQIPGLTDRLNWKSITQHVH